MVRNPLFWGMLSSSLIAQLEAKTSARVWPARTVIFHQGDRCDGLHIVRHGLIKLYVASADGREQTLSLQPTSAVLTLIPLLDGGPYPTSARALLPSRTLFLPRADWHYLLAESAELRQIVAREAGQTMRRMVSLMDSITLKPVAARVALGLLEEAERAVGGMQGAGFRLTVTQEELAHLIGATRETVARTFAQLRAAGVIEQRGAQVRIVDAQRLAQWTQNLNGPRMTQPT